MRSLSRIFKGRVVLGGNISGESIVTHQGFNILASYLEGLSTGSAICSDQNNKDLYKKDLKGKIICLPKTIGSTTGGMILQNVTKQGIGPSAMLFSEHIDSLAAAGIILCDVWNNTRIIAIDQLGDEFLKYAKDGQKIHVKDDGNIIID
ncbi:aconitase X swivel domain-containing protein [Clostridium tyrobutyricum]|uniref:aconitase X swivel domain-containing protein n=1 Tax=Clostridium tyrobutyricum TaxID=1519 RepID=UPI002ED1C441